MPIVGQLFVQRSADALRHAANDLALDDQRIDQRSGIAHDGVLEDFDLERVAIDLDDGDVQPAGESRAGRQEVVRGLQPGRHAIWQRPARRGGRGELSERNPAA